MNIIKVAKVVNSEEIIINKGSSDGIQIGQKMFIYAMGEEIRDPDSKEILESLEIVRGTGKVVHVQKKVAHVRTDMKTPSNRTISKKNPTLNALNVFGSMMAEEITEILPAQPVPFENPEVGDLARIIS